MKPIIISLLILFSAGLVGCEEPKTQKQTSPKARETEPVSQVVPAAKPKKQATLSEQLSAACVKLAKPLANQATGKKVAVLPLEDSDGGVRRLGVLLAEGMEQELLKRGAKLVDRQSLEKLLAERDFQISLLDSASESQKAGKLLGADVLIVGKTISAGNEVLLSARAIDTRTGRMLAAAKGQGLSKSKLDELMWYVHRPVKTTGHGELPPLSLRYELVTPVGPGEARLAEGSTVRSGQRFKIRVQPNSDCHLYILLYDSQGQASVLFPHKKIGMSNEVRGGVSYEIPEATKWYWFDEKTGQETFYIVASYTPIQELGDILAKMQQAGKGQVQLASRAKEEISQIMTRGMSSSGSARYLPKGYKVSTRGVGGVVEIAPSTEIDSGGVDRIVTGFATVVKKVVIQHR